MFKSVIIVQMDSIFMKTLVYVQKEKLSVTHQEIVYFVLSTIVITVLLLMFVLLAQMVMNFKEMNVFVLQELLSVIKRTHVSVVQLITVKLAAIPIIVLSVNQHLLWWMVFVLVLKVLLWALLLRNVCLVTSQIAKNVTSKMFVQIASTAIHSTQVLVLVFQVQL